MYHEIETEQQMVEDLQKSYLRRWGWVETCSTPGSYWLWRRDFADVDAQRKAWDDEHEAGKPGKPSPSVPYGVVTAPLDLAISMTVRCLDEQPELADEAA
jgi:hypothetical protein